VCVCGWGVSLCLWNKISGVFNKFQVSVCLSIYCLYFVTSDGVVKKALSFSSKRRGSMPNCHCVVKHISHNANMGGVVLSTVSYSLNCYKMSAPYRHIFLATKHCNSFPCSLVFVRKPSGAFILSVQQYFRRKYGAHTKFEGDFYPKVKRPKHEADHSAKPSGKVKKISLVPHVQSSLTYGRLYHYISFIYICFLIIR
jgi:hypothetical protein